MTVAQPAAESAKPVPILGLILWPLAALTISVMVPVLLWDGQVGSSMQLHKVLPAVPLFELALYFVILVVLPGEGKVPGRSAGVGIALALFMRAFAAAAAALLRHTVPNDSFGDAFLNFYAAYWVGALVQIAVVSFFLSLVRDLLESRPQQVLRRPPLPGRVETTPQRQARQDELLTALMDGSEAAQRRAGRGKRLSEAGAVAAPPAPVPVPAPPVEPDQREAEMPPPVSDEAPAVAPAMSTTDATDASGTASFPPVADRAPVEPETDSEPLALPAEPTPEMPQLVLMADDESESAADSEPEAPQPQADAAFGLFPVPTSAEASIQEALSDLASAIGATATAVGFSPLGHLLATALPGDGPVEMCLARLDPLLSSVNALADVIHIGKPSMSLMWLADRVAGIAHGGASGGIAVMGVVPGASPGPMTLALRRAMPVFEQSEGTESHPTDRRASPAAVVPTDSVADVAGVMSDFLGASSLEALGFRDAAGRTLLLLSAPGADHAQAAAEAFALDAEGSALAVSMGGDGYQRLVVGTESGGIALTTSTVGGQELTIALITRGRMEPGALGLQLSRALRALTGAEDAGAAPATSEVVTEQE